MYYLLILKNPLDPKGFGFIGQLYLTINCIQFYIFTISL